MHAKLARGNLGVRARVDGPLSPVAQSLNLLIERLQRWAQFERSNRVLESEANRLREVLDELSEGHLTPLPGSRSTLPTGAALVSTQRLQRHLALRFGRLREALDILERAGNYRKIRFTRRSSFSRRMNQRSTSWRRRSALAGGTKAGQQSFSPAGRLASDTGV